MENKYNYWKCANKIGLFFVSLFLLCFVWYYIRPVEQDLHLRLFRLSFLGFSGMNLASFILGAIQTYVWAYIVVGLWRLFGCCHKERCCKD